MFKTHRTYSLTTGVKNASIAVVAEGARVDVVYHRTTVVSKRGKTVTLNNGGWDTVSTRAVINQALSQIPTRERWSLIRHKGETLLTGTCPLGGWIRRPFTGTAKLRVAS